MIESILDAHQSAFSVLADAWMDQGVSSLYVTDPEGKLLLHWPPLRTTTVPASCSAAITIGNRAVAKLHLGGEATNYLDKYAQLRLLTDAKLLSDLLQVEYELQRMTGDIIEQQDQLMALHQLAQTSQVQHDLRDIMRTLTRIMAQLLKTNCTFITLLRPAQSPLCETTSPHLWPERLWQEIIDMAAAGAHEQQWLLQQCEYSGHRPPAPLKNLLMKRINLQQGNCVLLGAANKLHGNFQAPDLKLFGTIAGPAVATIENALLHQEMLDQTRIQTEMDLARQVQMRLLPQKYTTIADLQILGRTKPASQVGGDFFDLIDHKDGLFTFTIGDVSGKGMPAALMMAMLRTVLRSKLNTPTHIKPDRLLAEMNSILYPDFSDVDMFATIVVGQYDYHRHLLHYANDGHAPVIYRPADGRAHLLEADAPPLGVIDFHLACAHTLPFHTGDLLVITTDGFNEAERSDGALLGYEQMLTAVDDLATADVATIAEQLFSLANAFADGHAQSDDQTLLILKRMDADDL